MAMAMHRKRLPKAPKEQKAPNPITGYHQLSQRQFAAGSQSCTRLLRHSGAREWRASANRRRVLALTIERTHAARLE